MKISRVAILILVVVWGIILLVPPLNTLLCEQWQGSWSSRVSQWPNEKRVRVDWEEQAQLFPRDKNILLRVALTSPVVERNEIVGWEKLDPNLMGSPPNEAAALKSLPDKSPITVPIFRLAPLFPGIPARSSQAERLRRLHLLVKKYPQDVVLQATYLKYALLWLRSGRVGGEMADPDLYENRAAGKPSPEVAPLPPEYSQSDLQQVLAICEQGRKLEPDNAFFDWMKCYFLMLGWCDVQAIDALEMAAKKTHANDYSLPEIKCRMDALSTVLHRPLTVEEKQRLMWEHDFFVLSCYRALTRLFAWQVVKAQRRGDLQEAWRITAALMQVTALMRRKPSLEIEQLSAMSLEAIARSGIIHDARQTKQKVQSHIPPEQTLAMFVKLANQQGHSELAKTATLSFKTWQQRTDLAASRQSFTALFRTSYVVWILIELAYKACGVLLAMLPTVFALTLIPGLVSCVRTALRWNEVTSDEIPTSRAVRNCVLSLSIVLFLLPWLSLVLLSALMNSDVALWAEGTIPQARIYLQDQFLRFPFFPVGLLTPLLLGGLITAYNATQWQKRMNGEKMKRAVFFAGSCCFGILTVMWYAPLFLSGTFVAILSGLMLPFILTVKLFFDWHERPHRRAAVRYGLRLFQSSMTAWLVLCSVLYFVLAVSSLPVRYYADAQMEKIMVIGE